MNLYIFLLTSIILYIVLLPNFLIILPPEDFEWTNFKKYITKNSLSYITVIIHGLIYGLILYLLLFFSPKIKKSELLFDNYRTNNILNNIRLM